MGWVWGCSESWPKAQQSPSVSPLKSHGEQVQFSMIGKAQIYTRLPKRRSGKQQRSQLQVSPRIHYETGLYVNCCNEEERQDNWEDTTWVGQWQMIDQLTAIREENSLLSGWRQSRDCHLTSLQQYKWFSFRNSFRKLHCEMDPGL